MSDLTVNSGNVGPAFAHCRIRSLIGGASILGGAPVYVDANGLAQPASSLTAATAQFAGIAMPRMNNGYACGAGQACEVVEAGEVEGFTLSTAAYWAPVYLTDDGGIGLTAGTHAAQIGRVVPTTDRDGNGNLKKLLMVFSPWNVQTV
jgi:hypothetical protein